MKKSIIVLMLTGVFVTWYAQSPFIEDLSVTQSFKCGLQTVNSKTLSICPNPATDYICFNLPDQKFNKVQVSDVTGMLVKEVMGSSAVDILDLSNGVFVIKAFIETNVFVGKIYNVNKKTQCLRRKRQIRGFCSNEFSEFTGVNDLNSLQE